MHHRSLIPQGRTKRPTSPDGCDTFVNLDNPAMLKNSASISPPVKHHCILTWLLVKADIQQSLNQFSSRFALRSSFPCTHAPSNMIHSSLSLSLKPEFFDWQHANEPFIDTRPTRPIGLAYTASAVPPTTLLLGRIAVLHRPTQMLPIVTDRD